MVAAVAAGRLTRALGIDMRVAAAFLLAPVAPAIVAWLVLTSGLVRDPLIGQLLVVAAFSPTWSVPATLLAGLPLLFLFRRKGWLRLRHVLIGGVIVAVMATVVFAIESLLRTPNWYHVGGERLYIHWSSFHEGLSYAAVFVPFGVAIAFIFYAIAYWRTTDGDHQKSAGATDA